MLGRLFLERIGMAIVALDRAVGMYGGFEECVVRAVRIVPVLVSCRPRFAVGIFDLLDDVLSPRKSLENFDRLGPAAVF